MLGNDVAVSNWKLLQTGKVEIRGWAECEAGSI